MPVSDARTRLTARCVSRDGQRAPDGRRQQVAGGVVKRLNRQRDRTVLARRESPLPPAAAMPQLIWTRLSKPRRSRHGPSQP